MCRRCGEGSYRASRSATLHQAALAGKSCLDQVEPFVHTSESAVHLAVQAVTYTRDEMCQFLEFGIHGLLESTVRDFGSGSGSVHLQLFWTRALRNSGRMPNYRRAGWIAP